VVPYRTKGSSVPGFSGFSVPGFSPGFSRWGNNPDGFYWMDAYLGSVSDGTLPSVTSKITYQ